MDDIRMNYKKRIVEALNPISESILNELNDYLKGVKNIDRISVRVKSEEKFLVKANKEINGKKKYEDPLNQIQDQIGARIITFYLDDVSTIEKKIREYYHPIEIRSIVPESESEFGYQGKHLMLLIPNEILGNYTDTQIPKFFELQIKTLFQHAWSEANHDICYKPNTELDSIQKRKIAFTAAQAWGADIIFEELRKELS
jgi:putative GTP pyrophosphokinase